MGKILHRIAGSRWGWSMLAGAMLTVAFISLSPLTAQQRQTQQRQTTNAASDIAAHQKLLTTYCTGCHNERTKIGGLALDTLDVANPATDAVIWERAIRKLRGGMMPPPGMPQPERAAIDAFVSHLETTLDRAAAQNPRPGYVALHRINRTEYANAVKQILGLEVNPTDLLPQDDISDGFENIAGVLKVSPSFLDQYVTAARFVTTGAVGSANPRSETISLRAAPGTDQDHYVEGLPLGTRGGFASEHVFPADGQYTFNIAGLATGGYVQNMDFRHTVLLLIDGEKVFEGSIGGEADMKTIDQGQAPGLAEVRGRFENIKLQVSAGRHEVAATFVARTLAESDERLQSFTPGAGVTRVPHVGSIQVVGPVDANGPGLTPSRRKIFSCMPQTEEEEIPCATEIFSRLAREAFRRPVNRDDLKAPLAFFEQSRAEGGFESGIQAGLMTIFASPKFLYRVEGTPVGIESGEIYRLRDLDLASRLSYFLWSAGPDDRLLELANAGRLNDPAVLESETLRMLRDPRAHSLVTNFAFQWLNMVALDNIDPDPVLFPEFDAGLRAAFMEEMELFLGSIIEEDRGALDLLSAPYTFLNERLALHYGIPNVRGSRFRRVTLADPNRWGLLGKGAVLMVTSYPNRTSSVLRGAWVLERLLGTPPAPPPPDVEAFPETQEGQKALSVRERMELHRANPSCNACHGVMDPLGFSLENYDAIGAWRDFDRWAGVKIDASGKLVNGTPVSSPKDLQQALVAQSEMFVRTMTEKLMMYALGRSVEAQDMPAVRAIVLAASRDQYKFSSLVMGIVSSDAFQTRINLPEDEVAGVAAE